MTENKYNPADEEVVEESTYKVEGDQYGIPQEETGGGGGTVNKNSHDKVKQFIAKIGGFLGALLLALRGSGVDLGWYTQESIDLWMNVLYTAVPLGFAGYGVWKNQFLVTGKARKQEEVLKEKGLK